MFTKELLLKLYKNRNNRLRRIIRSIIYRLEKGELYSITLRKIFEQYHDVKIGFYTMGGCFSPYQVDRYTTIGRYCSFAKKIRILNRNHPLDFISTHALFFNPQLNYCNKNPIQYIPLKIGNDVWVGHNAVIMPNVTEIADGAVVGSGAVLSKNLPHYAVATGNPARIVRYRFSKKTIDKLLDSRWWDKSPEDIRADLDSFQAPYAEKAHVFEDLDN